jgi:hypothetical protein
MTIPFRLRGDKIGRHSLCLVFVYQAAMDDDSTAANNTSWRSFRYSVELKVVPSLKLNAFIRSSDNFAGNYILGVEMENLTPDGDVVKLSQLTSLSPLWQLDLINSNEWYVVRFSYRYKRTILPLSTSDFTIGSRQTSFTYYRISYRQSEKAASNLVYQSERFTSDALEALITGRSIEQLKAPPINLVASHILLDV